MTRIRRRAFLSTAIAGAIAPGCLGNDSPAQPPDQPDNDTDDNETDTEEPMEPSQDALVRFAHLSPDLPRIDVLGGDTIMFEDVEPISRGEYRSFRPGTYPLSLRREGTQHVQQEVTLKEGHTTIYAIGERCGYSERPLRLLALEDGGSVPDDVARIRGLHASPDLPAVDVVVEDGPVLFEGLEFGQPRVAEVSPGEAVIGIHSAGERDDPVRRFPIEPEAGHAYTGVGVGYLDPAAAPSTVPEDFGLGLAVLEDAVE